MESQIGRRWLREQTYVEDGVADVATRLQEKRDGDKDAVAAREKRSRVVA